MRYLKNYIWAIVWAILMLTILLLPSRSFEVDSVTFYEGFDKMVHCGIFFILCILLYWESILKSKRSVNKWLSITKVVISTVIFAFVTEAAQQYLSPTRTADLWDIFADITGIGMATFAFIFFYKREK
ncbi:hypothetical protein SAMN05660841_02025 [Sphingobacterium nematocida]|uniref:VanZ like family protein n=1 Tax=Sphingobacterium nematocida TaxID=1513896 RepID=A0A1T5DJI5_9SPHI|nr:VanZ family protein [Sphingobacterium nematocida]SKB71918.1 hypothetical protein SAMN05660841_02025 [Sphingobacterium nematocida]